MTDLIHIPEPRLLFRHDQAMEDPRDGLTLFGPLDESKPYGIKAGVIGTETGVRCFERWVEWVQRPVFNTTPLLGRPPFPGFETVFRSALEYQAASHAHRHGRRDRRISLSRRGAPARVRDRGRFFQAHSGGDTRGDGQTGTVVCRRARQGVEVLPPQIRY